MEDRAQRYYDRGINFLSQKDYVRAGIEFKNALQLNKNHVGAWRGMARLEENNQNWQGLAAVLRTVIELDLKDIDSRLQLARLLVLGNLMNDALDLVNAAGEINDKHVGVLATRAVILFKLDDHRGAVREARAALDVDPENIDASVVLAADRFARNDVDGALSVLDKVSLERTSADPERSLSLDLFKLKIFEHMKDHEQVEALLKKLAKGHSQQRDFRKLLIQHYLNQKRFDEAETELRAAATANPADDEASRDLLRFLQSVKGPEAVRLELSSRIKAGIEVIRNQMELANFEYSLGMFDEGTQLLETIIKTGSREQVLAARITLAEAYRRMKKLEAAEAVVAEILRGDTRNPDGLRLRAMIKLDRGQLETAIADAREALNSQPQSTQLMLLLAIAYERSGSIELADRQFANAVRTSDWNPSVALEYVTFLRRRRSVERVEDVLTELAGRFPNHIGALSNLAQARLARGNFSGAQEVAAQIQRVGDREGLADRIRGLVLSRMGRHDESIKLLESGYSRSAGTWSMFALVDAYRQAQRPDLAEEFLQRVLEDNPDDAEARVLQGLVQLRRNPYETLKNFQTAVARQPTNVVAVQALARFYMGLYYSAEKDFDKALKVVRAALQHAPNDVDLRMTLVEVLTRKEDYEGAIDEFESMLKQQPESLIVVNNLASLLADHRSDKASLDRAYSLALALRQSNIPSFKDTLGWIYHLRGEHKNAIPLLEEAAAALPNSAVVQYHLGMSYLAIGQAAKAAELLAKARKLSSDSELQKKIEAAEQKLRT